jgi:hypothetical protein
MYEELRPVLCSIAYRMVCSASDAETSFKRLSLRCQPVPSIATRRPRSRAGVLGGVTAEAAVLSYGGADNPR